MKKLTVVFIGLFIVASSYGQEHKETIRKKIPLPKSAEAILVVENIFGKIDVEGYNGDTVLFEIESLISADSQKELEEAMKKVYLSFETREDTVDAFVNGICGCRQNQRGHFDWENQCNFKYKYDFKVKVPSRANLKISTVTDGEVTIHQISGSVTARNVNGGITIGEVSGPTDVNCINGDVEIKYTKNPVQNSKYYSLNGDVNIFYIPGLSADVSFKTFQGNMFTSFDIAEWLPPVKVSTSSKDGNVTTYRIENINAVRIGKGGVKLDFETFNGNVFVRKI